MANGFDCFARRQENGYVVRIAGSEYLLTADEWNDFFECCQDVYNGKRVSESTAYQELRHAKEAERTYVRGSLLAELGLIKPAEGIRRRI